MVNYRATAVIYQKFRINFVRIFSKKIPGFFGAEIQFYFSVIIAPYFLIIFRKLTGLEKITKMTKVYGRATVSNFTRELVFRFLNEGRAKV